MKAQETQIPPELDKAFRQAVNSILKKNGEPPATDVEWSHVKSLPDVEDQVREYSRGSEESQTDTNSVATVLSVMRRYARDINSIGAEGSGRKLHRKKSQPNPNKTRALAEAALQRTLAEAAEQLSLNVGEQPALFSLVPGAKATARVVNAFAAIAATKLPEVRRFRRKHLKGFRGTLLPDLEGILHFLWDGQEGRDTPPWSSVEYRGILFVGKRGLIPAVRRTVKLLCDRYGWTGDSAVEFLLAGEIPQGDLVLMQVHGNGPRKYITMRFPAYLTETEVAAIFSKACKERNLHHPRFRDAVADKVESIAKHVMNGKKVSTAARESSSAWKPESEEMNAARASSARCQFNRARRMLETVAKVETFEDFIDRNKLRPYYLQLRDLCATHF